MAIYMSKNLMSLMCRKHGEARKHWTWNCPPRQTYTFPIFASLDARLICRQTSCGHWRTLARQHVIYGLIHNDCCPSCMRPTNDFHETLLQPYAKSAKPLHLGSAFAGTTKVETPLGLSPKAHHISDDCGYGSMRPTPSELCRSLAIRRNDD